MNAERYESRPVPVTAMQVVKPYKRVAEWCGGKVYTRSPGQTVYTIILEGNLWAHVGSWIVKLPDGTFTVMTDEKFRATYREVES